MEVTITNNGGYITIDDGRDPALPSTLNVLKDGLDLLQFGDVLRIVYKDGTWFESLATQSEVVGLSGSITPADGLEFYAAMWDVLADYGSGGGGGGSGTVTNVSALTIGTSGTNITSTVANPTTTPVITLNIPTASASNRGALSSTDWSTFNGKQGALGFTPENVANKSTDVATDQASTTKYPSVKAVFDWAKGLFAEKTGIPLLCLQETYPVGTNNTGITYVPSVNKLYVCNFGSNSVTILDTLTGSVLATISVTGAFQPFYIASINEVWITSTSLTTINRISTSLNSSLGTITGATANGGDFVEYSSTKVFICCQNASGSIMVVNPSTLSVTATVTTNVPATPAGMCLNTNSGSSQYDKIIVSGSAGLAIFNPSTNAISTTVANPSSSVSTGTRIRYVSSTNQYVLANFGTNSVLVFDVASATTFTLNTTIRTFTGTLDVCVDETAGYIFSLFIGLTSGTTLFVSIIDITTKKVLITIPTNVISGSASTSGRISIDSTNKRLYVCGRSAVANSSTAIKYV